MKTEIDKMLTPAEIAEIQKLATLPLTHTLCDSHEALRAEALRANCQIGEWENKEAAICPEDVGFPEFIASLQKQITRLRGMIEGMGHENDCGRNFRRKCDCAQSKVNL